MFRGALATREFIAFWLKDGRLVAGMNVNVWDVAGTIGALVAGQRTVAAARLTDPMSSLTAWSNDTGRRSTLGVLCQPWS